MNHQLIGYKKWHTRFTEYHIIKSNIPCLNLIKWIQAALWRLEPRSDLPVEPTVQLEASLGRIIASSLFSRAQESLSSPTAREQCDSLRGTPQAPTLQGTNVEITTKMQKPLKKASKSKSRFNINVLLH